MKSPEIVSRHANIAIKRSMINIFDSTKDTTPVRTSRLVGSFQIQYSNLRGEIYPTAKYAYWVHEGSGIHAGHSRWLGKIPELIGKNGPHDKGIRWIKGQKGNPYLKNAVDRTQDKINQNFKQGLSDALAEIARK